MEVFHDVNVFPQHDTVYYLLETEIGESFIDLSENEVNYYYRSRYDNSTSELIDKRAWTIFKNHERVEVVEENQRKTKMVFAVRNHTTWDVNAFNDFDSEEVYYFEEGEEFALGSTIFENTVKINYEDFSSLVDYRKKYEVYAKGVGLVKKSFKDFRIENFDTTAI